MNRLLLFLLFLSPGIFAQNWTALDDFPGTERDDGVSFKIGETAYCGTGRDGSFAYRSDFYAFDIISESWAPIAALPAGNERQYAAGFTDGEFGYVCGGTNGNNFNDLWRYNPTTDSWEELTPLPASGRSGAAAFVIDQTAYLVGGRDADEDALNEVWAYDIQNDSWLQLADMPFGGRWRSSATTLDQLGYLIFGWDDDINYRAECYEYDPETDSWMMVSEFPEGGRTHAAMVPVDDHFVVFGGTDSEQNVYNDLWSFSPLTSTWEELSPMPAAGRKGGMSFIDNGVFYYTTGINGENERLQETWKCAVVTSTEEMPDAKEIRLFPNPVKSVLNIEWANDMAGFYDVSIYDVNAVCVMQMVLPASGAKLAVDELKPGMYFLEISAGEEKWVKRFVKGG